MKPPRTPPRKPPICRAICHVRHLQCAVCHVSLCVETLRTWLCNPASKTINQPPVIQACSDQPVMRSIGNSIIEQFNPTLTPSIAQAFPQSTDHAINQPSREANIQLRNLSAIQSNMHSKISQPTESSNQSAAQSTIQKNN